MNSILDSSRRVLWPPWRVPSAEIAVPCLLIALLVCLLLVPLFVAIAPPVGGSVLDANQPLLSPGHPLGTDLNGNDVLSRLIYGGRTSLLIAVAVNLTGLLAGGSIGITSAFAGSLADAIISRVLDAMIAFPALVLVLALAAALPPGTFSTFIALTIFCIPSFARLARTAALHLRQLPFVTAADLCGAAPISVIVRHVIPHLLPQLLTFGLLSMGTIINVEGAVSFLGLGVQLPQPSWGGMMDQGQMALSFRPSLVLLPCGLLFVSSVAFNLLGESLRARWNRP
jgi:peptide/nickel transport system permease protein